MTKKEARKFFKDQRKSIAPSQKRQWDDLILIQFQQVNLSYLETLFSYLPMQVQNEVDTVPIVRYLQFMNPQLSTAYPVCDFTNNTMHAALADSDTLFVTNHFGAAEPESSRFIAPRQIDLVLVPLLCFDNEGYRVGYGKGFYDRFLSQARSDVYKIGLSYFGPIEKITDSDAFDVTLTHCITPQKIYEF